MRHAFLSDYIQQVIEKQGLTREEFARRTGLSRAGFYKLMDKLNGKDVGELRLSTLIKLARGLDMSYLALIHELTGAPLGGNRTRNRRPAPDDRLRVINSAANATATVRCGEDFVRSWNLHNAGTMPWDARRLVCLDGYICAMRHGTRCGTPLVLPEIQPLDDEIVIPPTAPGDTTMVQTRFRAPAEPGVAVSYWKMVNATGEFCFPGLTDVICSVQSVES